MKIKNFNQFINEAINNDVYPKKKITMHDVKEQAHNTYTLYTCDIIVDIRDILPESDWLSIGYTGNFLENVHLEVNDNNYDGADSSYGEYNMTNDFFNSDDFLDSGFDEVVDEYMLSNPLADFSNLVTI